MEQSMDYFILWTALLLGLRHSLDFDHLAAVADIAGAQSSRKSSLAGCVAYAIGHAGIVMVMGGAALLLGFSLPPSLAAIMEKIVGATLLILAAAIIISALKFRDQGKIISRWRILYSAIDKVRHYFGKKNHSHSVDANKDDLSFRGCLAIGVLHGIGVESPTQILAIGSALTISNHTLAMVTLAMFGLGMTISCLLVAVLAIYGFQSARQRATVFLVLSVISAIFSAIIGVGLLLS